MIAVSLAACMSAEERAIQNYVEEAQGIAERLVVASVDFQGRMDAQEDPLAWSAESKTALQANLDTFEDLEAEAKDMRVPPELVDVHPLLIEALGDMSAAVRIIVDIANDPETATEANVDEMTTKAESAEKLSGEYVQKLQTTLEAKYPEMLEDLE